MREARGQFAEACERLFQTELLLERNDGREVAEQTDGAFDFALAAQRRHCHAKVHGVAGTGHGYHTADDRRFPIEALHDDLIEGWHFTQELFCRDVRFIESENASRRRVHDAHAPRAVHHDRAPK